MLNMSFISQGNSRSNQVNFVPVLLSSVLDSQPELGWDMVGSLSYTYASSGKILGYTPERADVVGHTVYYDFLIHPEEIRKTERTIRSANPNSIFVIGGPVGEQFADVALLKTNADFFFSGSALWSFRKFCEHVAACKDSGVDLDREYLRTLPGLYQRVGETIISPLSNQQPTDFIRKLRLDPTPLLNYDFDNRFLDRFVLPYPMFNPCPGKCSFCLYNPIGVPLTREQKWEYLERSRKLAEPRKSFHPKWYGPNFDFGDTKFLEELKHDRRGYHIMSMVTAFLEPGAVGNRPVREDRIESIFSQNMQFIHFGVESLTPQIRDEMGKDPFTNEELERILKAIANAKTSKGYGDQFPIVRLLMLPPDITSCFLDFSSNTLSLLELYERFGSLGLILTTSWNRGCVYPYPDTPDFEILNLFRERFPKLFKEYFKGNIHRMPGEQHHLFYSGSIPLDPITRSALGSLENLIRDRDEDNPLMIHVRAYLRLLATYTYEKQFLGSGVVYDGIFNEAVQNMAPLHGDYLKLMEREDMLKKLKRGSLSELKRRFMAEYREHGRAHMKWAMKHTPIRDPEAYQVWNHLGDARKAMTFERKKGNPEWKAVGRRMAFA